MTLAPPAVRRAKAVLATHRKQQRKERPKPVMPTAAGQRAPRIVDKAFLAFVRTQPCAVGPVGCSGPVEAAHIRYGAPGAPNPGLQRKSNDRRCVPLCTGHHRLGPGAQHSMNERAFWASHGKDPDVIAAGLGRRFDGGAR